MPFRGGSTPAFLATATCSESPFLKPDATVAEVPVPKLAIQVNTIFSCKEIPAVRQGTGLQPSLRTGVMPISASAMLPEKRSPIPPSMFPSAIPQTSQVSTFRGGP